MTRAFVLKIKNPVPSNSFIKSPVRDRRPSAKSTSRPPPLRNSAMRFTAYGEPGSTGNVLWLIINFRCSQLVCAERLDVTNFQFSSRQTQRNSQSIHEV